MFHFSLVPLSNSVSLGQGRRDGSGVRSFLLAVELHHAHLTSPLVIQRCQSLVSRLNQSLSAPHEPGREVGFSGAIVRRELFTLGTKNKLIKLICYWLLLRKNLLRDYVIIC